MNEMGADETLDLRAWMKAFKTDRSSPLPPEQQQALALARHLLARAKVLQTPPEKRQQAELDRLLQTPQDKSTLIQMTDQAFRSRSSRRAVDQFIHILDVQGVPRFFSAVERTLLKGFQSFGGFLPGVAVPLVKDRMQKETANVILPAETEVLQGHLRKRREQHLRMNVNILGEAILGEREAARRLEQYLEMLQWDEIEVVSVKISTLYSQIHPLAREQVLSVLCERLELLFRTAARQQYTRPDGVRVAKMVYLDMEDYRDLDLTAEAFMRTLDRPGLGGVRAGIALQAYIPDSFAVQQRLISWARRRLDRNGTPVTMRLVKGANMEMERAEASARGWPQASFKEKVDTDAHFKRMLLEALPHVDAVRLAVASHNLFDVAYALILTTASGQADHIHFEMLEGMANHQRRALGEAHADLLLYAPVCSQKDFIHAIGYLVRRLDENTGPENFLRHTFRLDVDSEDWRLLEQGFLASFKRMKTLSSASRRIQNRRAEPHAARTDPMDWRCFVNEPDTDFILRDNIAWAEELIAQARARCEGEAPDIPVVVDGEERAGDRPVKACLDPSRPGARIGQVRQGTADDVDRAVAVAAEDPDGWRRCPPRERHALLGQVAAEIRGNRAVLMGVALAEGGKTLVESDPEVSEAVDFVEFYREVALELQERSGLTARGRGVVAAVSPWNFPIAIPCGSVAAALAAGNTVILKPSSDTVWTAWELCQCFWRAGVSRRVLQFLPCAGGTEGQRLVSHPDVQTVLLTGGTTTAETMLAGRPDMDLLAETGGKNATIVTAMADRDLAIKHVIHSAFSHSGQKCSATSLLLLEEEVFEDREFREALCDAAESMRVGSAWEVSTRMGPLIRPPSGDLETGLKTLDKGESWALRPKADPGHPNLWSPGIKWGVQPGSFTHLTELFGPVLGVMRFKKLDEAVALVNQTGYGLTSGLESLDDREQAVWQQTLHAGNLYINRPTTGAIVLRQPFGGMGKSAFGPGLKAGGPHYVVPLSAFEEAPGQAVSPAREPLAELARRVSREPSVRSPATRQSLDRLLRGMASYEQWHAEEFSQSHDSFRRVGQDNYRRYRPIREMRIRVPPEDSFFEVFARVCAARQAGCRITVSVATEGPSPWVELLEELTEAWAGGIEFVEETDAVLASVIRNHLTERVRYAARERVPESIWKAASESAIYLATAPVLAEGRVEMLWYFEEQSLSHDYHRYGNLGARAREDRTEPD